LQIASLFFTRCNGVTTWSKNTRMDNYNLLNVNFEKIQFVMNFSHLLLHLLILWQLTGLRTIQFLLTPFVSRTFENVNLYFRDRRVVWDAAVDSRVGRVGVLHQQVDGRLLRLLGDHLQEELEFDNTSSLEIFN
jgi:hypothetical protein